MTDKLSILLIEDNEDDYLLTNELIDQRTTTLTWRRSLAEALSTLEHQLFDAILLDLGIPDSEGIETFDRLVHALEHMPVIVVLTGSDDEELANQALQRGAQDYLIKGRVDRELLARALRYSIERHRADKQVRETNEELVAINKQLVLARDEALESSRLKTEFLANLSHEIRTPMSGIVSFSELLSLEKDVRPEVKEMIDCVHESSLRLISTLNDLLDLSKLEAGRMVLKLEKCCVRTLLSEIVQTVKPTALRKRLSIVEDISDSVPESFYTDPVRLRQIVLNFAHNAVKFSADGQIRIEAEATNTDMAPYLKFTVTDSGIGIPEKVQHMLFRPFMQADGSTTRRYGGTGLGLAISKRSAELLGGEIGFTSEEGHGSSFWCKIPISDKTEIP